MDFDEFFKEESKQRSPIKEDNRDKPWADKKNDDERSMKTIIIMKSTQMQRAKAFIKSVISGKDKKDIEIIKHNIIMLIE